MGEDPTQCVCDRWLCVIQAHTPPLPPPRYSYRVSLSRVELAGDVQNSRRYNIDLLRVPALNSAVIMTSGLLILLSSGERIQIQSWHRRPSEQQ